MRSIITDPTILFCLLIIQASSFKRLALARLALPFSSIDDPSPSSPSFGKPFGVASNSRAAAVVLLPRGGADEDSSENDSSENGIDFSEEDGEEAPRSATATRSGLSAALRKLYPCCQSLLKRARRGWAAGRDAACSDPRGGDEDDADLPKLHSFLGKTGFVLQEMRRAALADESEGGSDRIDATAAAAKRKRRSIGGESRGKSGKRRHGKKHPSAASALACNGGGIDRHQDQDSIQSLLEKYGIQPTPKHSSSVFTSAATSFQQALTASNAHARFLICYISKSPDHDDLVLPALLDPQFIRACNRKPLAKKNLQDTGSYYLWICAAKSEGEAASASKRLKIKDNKQNSILTILHPATTLHSSNRLGVTPRIVAKHHCNPPPSSAESLSEWIGAVRKRHLKEFARLQFEKKERGLSRERSEGYKKSVEEDKLRQQKEEEQSKKRQEEEEREMRRKEEIEERRKELLKSLGDEPESGDGIVTVALRFQSLPSYGNGNGGEAPARRRFAKSDAVNDVFDWIDAVHGLEREKVALSTMNGSKSFRYGEGEDLTLEEAGLGRMVALRVGLLDLDLDEGVSADEEEEE